MLTLNTKAEVSKLDFVKVCWTRSSGVESSAMGHVRYVENEKVFVDYGIDGCGHPFENDYLFTSGNRVYEPSESEVKKFTKEIKSAYGVEI